MERLFFVLQHSFHEAQDGHNTIPAQIGILAYMLVNYTLSCTVVFGSRVAEDPAKAEQAVAREAARPDAEAVSGEQQL